MKKYLLILALAASAALPFLLITEEAESNAQAAVIVADAPAVDIKAAQDHDDDLKALVDKVYPAFVRINGGSGVCISPDGYVLTNHHVAPEATTKYRSGSKLVKVSVNMPGRTKAYTALPMAADPRGDIVLLKIQLEEGETLPFAPLADSDKVQTGDIAVAIGNPFLLGSASNEPSVSTGVISARGRHQSGYSDGFQVDAAVNPGNSGGPSFTIDGHVLGINGRILTAHGGRYNTGLGYAIPAHQIKRFLPTMKSHHGGANIVRHGLVSGLAMKHDARRLGCEVLDVRQYSTAYHAGFLQGDIVTKIGDYKIRGVSGFYGKLCTWPQGATVKFTVLRGEEVKTMEARLEVPVLYNQSMPWPYPTDRAYLESLDYVPNMESEFIFQSVGTATRQKPARGGGFMAEPGPSVSFGVAGYFPSIDVAPSIKGIRLVKVIKGGSCDGVVKDRDVLTHFDGRRMFYNADLKDCLLGFKAGDKVKLKLLRDGKPVEAEVTLQGR